VSVLEAVELALSVVELVIIGAMGLVMLAWTFRGRTARFLGWAVVVGEWIVDGLNKLGDPPWWR